MDSWVAIDVEPGNPAPGHIGLVEVVDRRPGDPIRFEFVATRWWEDAWRSWDGRGAYYEMLWNRYNSRPYRGSDYSEEREHRALYEGYYDAWAYIGKPPHLSEIWPYIEAFVADRPVVAYNAGYDRGALHRLLTSSGLPYPRWRWACSMQMGKRVWRRTCMWWIVKERQLLPPGYLAEHPTSQWQEDPTGTFWNAGEDALGAALIAQGCIRDGEYSSLEDAVFGCGGIWPKLWKDLS